MRPSSLGFLTVKGTPGILTNICFLFIFSFLAGFLAPTKFIRNLIKRKKMFLRKNKLLRFYQFFKWFYTRYILITSLVPLLTTVN